MRRLLSRASVRAAAAATAFGASGLSLAYAKTHCEPAKTWATTSIEPDLVLSADVGGTNSRFKLFRVPAGASIQAKQKAPGTVIFESKSVCHPRDSSLLMRAARERV